MLLRRRRPTLRWAARGAVTDPSGTSGAASARGRPRGSDPVEELERLAKLHADGALTDAEFTRAKSQLLGVGGNEQRGRQVSDEQRVALLERAIRASMTGDSSVIAELFTSDVEGWSPSMSVSSAVELAVEFEDRAKALSEIELDVRALDVRGTQACIEWVVTATHSGPLPIDDDEVVPPTGCRLTIQGVTIADFEGMKIRAFRQYWDEAGLLEQVDLLPRD